MGRRFFAALRMTGYLSPKEHCAMPRLRRIWDDIRRGKNIDLYLTILVAIGMTVLILIGFNPALELLSPLTLTVLALIAFATLGNRYKLEEVLHRVSRLPGGFFQEKYPP